MDSIKKEFEEQANALKQNMVAKKNSMENSYDRGVVKVKRFTKKLLLSILGIILFAIVIFFFWGNYTYSEGTRAGDLIKISRKGYVFKTYEGQLKLGGIDLSNPKEGLSDTWSFSVQDKAMVEKLEKLQGHKVVLRYCEKNYSMPWQGDTDYFILGVEE